MKKFIKGLAKKLAIMVVIYEVKKIVKEKILGKKDKAKNKENQKSKSVKKEQKQKKK
jgi:hypothetical protein